MKHKGEKREKKMTYFWRVCVCTSFAFSLTKFYIKKNRNFKTNHVFYVELKLKLHKVRNSQKNKGIGISWHIYTLCPTMFFEIPCSGLGVVVPTKIHYWRTDWLMYKNPQVLLKARTRSPLTILQFNLFLKNYNVNCYNFLIWRISRIW